MWIAKPINALTSEEKSQWIKITESKLPLSQTLRWAQAATSAGARAWLIFSPDENVGGTVLELDEPGVLECINGPYLDWDKPDRVTRQLATFAMSASKVTSQFRSLRLLPRWNSNLAKDLLNKLPIEPTASLEASTMIVSLDMDEEKLWSGFHSRLRRSLKTAIKENATASWTHPNQESITAFAKNMKEFGKERNFFVPHAQWFHEILDSSLSTEKIEFGIVQASFPNEQARAEILIAILGDVAYYLFGWETRASNSRAALSPSAWAHFTAMKEAKKRGALHYDFNGYIKNVEENDPYAGVCRFKEQWGGEVKTFFQPEYVIE